MKGTRSTAGESRRKRPPGPLRLRIDVTTIRRLPPASPSPRPPRLGRRLSVPLYLSTNVSASPCVALPCSATDCATAWSANSPQSCATPKSCPGRRRPLKPPGNAAAQRRASGTFHALPDELVLRILQQPQMLPVDHARVAQTCRRMRRLANDASLWHCVTLVPFRSIVDDRLVRSLCMTRFAVVCPHRNRLTSLDLSGCSNIGDASLQAIARCAPELQAVALAGCIKVTDRGIRTMAAACANLAIVNLRWCGEVTDSGIADLALLCPQLQQLELTWTGVTDAGLVAVARYARRLEQLAVRCNSAITDNGVGSVVFSCPRLRKLDVSMCDRLTDQFLYSVMTRGGATLPLQELSILSAKISHQALEAFRAWPSARPTRTISF